MSIVKVVQDPNTGIKYPTVEHFVETTGVKYQDVMKESCVLSAGEYNVLDKKDVLNLCVKYAVLNNNYKCAIYYYKCIVNALEYAVSDAVVTDDVDPILAMNACLSVYAEILDKRKQEKDKRLVKNKVKKDQEKQNEKYIQRELQSQLGGQIEVKTPYGYIDLLTEDRIIEVKNAKAYKSAIGQILAYGKSYPNHKKTICLFGDIDSINLDNVIAIFQEYDIDIFLMVKQSYAKEKLNIVE